MKMNELPQHRVARLQDKAVLVRLNCAFSWGTITDKRLTEDVTNEQHSVDGSIRVRKTLLPNESGKRVKAVQAALSEMYGYHIKKTFGIDVEGERMMPSQFYMDYMERFATAERKGNIALNDLVDNFEADVDAAKRLLKGSFNRDDYPDPEEIKQYFILKVKFLPIPTGNAIMNALGESVAAEVDGYADEMMRAVSEDAKTRLRKAVQLMAERLTTKGAKIYDTMPGAINDLAATLPEIAGLSGDPEFSALVQEVKQTLGGYNGDDFRNNEALKTDVGKAAMDLLRRMG